MSLFCDRYLTEEEVRVFLFRCPFHKFIKRQSPVDKEVQLTNLQREYCSVCVCVC